VLLRYTDQEKESLKFQFLAPTEDNLPQYRKVEKKYPNQLVRSTTWSEYMKGLKEKYNREKKAEKIENKGVVE